MQAFWTRDGIEVAAWDIERQARALAARHPLLRHDLDHLQNDMQQFLRVAGMFSSEKSIYLRKVLSGELLEDCYAFMWEHQECFVLIEDYIKTLRNEFSEEEECGYDEIAGIRLQRRKLEDATDVLSLFLLLVTIIKDQADKAPIMAQVYALRTRLRGRGRKDLEPLLGKFISRANVQCDLIRQDLALWLPDSIANSVTFSKNFSLADSTTTIPFHLVRKFALDVLDIVYEKKNDMIVVPQKLRSPQIFMLIDKALVVDMPPISIREPFYANLLFPEVPLPSQLPNDPSRALTAILKHQIAFDDNNSGHIQSLDVADGLVIMANIHNRTLISYNLKTEKQQEYKVGSPFAKFTPWRVELCPWNSSYVFITGWWKGKPNEMVTYNLENNRRLSVRRAISTACVKTSEGGVAVMYQLVSGKGGIEEQSNMIREPHKGQPEMAELSANILSENESQMLKPMQGTWYAKLATNGQDIAVVEEHNGFFHLIIFDSGALLASKDSEDPPPEKKRVIIGSELLRDPSYKYSKLYAASDYEGYTLASMALSLDSNYAVLVWSVPKADLRYHHATVQIWVVDVESGRADHIAVPGLTDPANVFISRDCRYAVIRNIIPSLVGKENEKLVHILDLETRKLAAVVGDKDEPTVACGFGPGAKEGTYVLAMAFQTRVDIYELR